MEETAIDATESELCERFATIYEAQRSLFIPSAQCWRFAESLGGRRPDLAALHLDGDDLPPDPTLPFRRSRNGRYCFNSRRQEIRRLEHQPFVLSAEEDFVRHDSGQVRRFAELTPEVHANPVFRALLALNFLLIDGVDTAHRPSLDYTSELWVCTVFHLRTVTTSALQGEPALEGVHSDGADHTMTVLVGGSNLHPHSAETVLHDNREQNGRRQQDADPDLVLGRYRHVIALDTLLLADHERKHSVSPVLPTDHQAPAARDMFVIFTRKPTLSNHASNAYDSLAFHPVFPDTITVPEDIV